MSLDASVKVKATQVTPVVTGEGDLDFMRSTKLGALYIADWRTQLLMAGLVWHADVGTVSSGADVSLIGGGGGESTINSDRPEFVIGVDAGHYLIPLDVRCCIQGDLDADAEEMNIVLFADRTNGPVTANASGTLETPVNMLDGGSAFPGRCWSATTSDITDPITDQILDFVTCQASQTTAVGVLAIPIVRMHYHPRVPPILKGPCQVVLCWGGTALLTGAAHVIVAAVPTSYFPVN